MRAVEQLVTLELSCEAAEEEELPPRDDEPQEDVRIVDEEVHITEDVSDDESFAHMAGRDVEHESLVSLSV